MATKRFSASQAGLDSPLQRFYADVAAADLQPLWTQDNLLPACPPISDIPFAWKWKEVRDLAARSGELVAVDRGGDRRVLALCNPGLGGEPYATRTLWGAIQYLGPGESAPAHRHTPAALRFVVEGSGVWTLVDGDPITMNPGDLVLTPSWCWHEHRSAGDEPMMWFDGLDLPMIRALDSVFFERPSEINAVELRRESRSEMAYGLPGLLPESEPAIHRVNPLLVYRWPETDAALTRLQELAESQLVSIRFTDPSSGRDALPTIRCSAQRLLPGWRTPTTRRTGSSIWVTVEGTATAIVDGEAFHLERGDMLAVPSWSRFDLEASDVSTFFTMSDAPVIEAIGLQRSEELPENQEVCRDRRGA